MCIYKANISMYTMSSVGCIKELYLYVLYTIYVYLSSIFEYKKRRHGVKACAALGGLLIQVLTCGSVVKNTPLLCFVKGILYTSIFQ